jgi:hypothetical protein
MSSVKFFAGSIGQAVLTNVHMRLARNGHAQADVLARNKMRQEAAIRWFQIKGNDVFTFVHFFRHYKFVEISPAPWQLFRLAVELFLHLDEQVGQHLIGFRPGLQDAVICRTSQHLADGRQEMLVDNGVMFGFDTDVTVFVGDAQHGIFYFIEPVDVQGGEHRIGQSTLLFFLFLVGNIN